jgi:hypothetical protein
MMNAQSRIGLLLAVTIFSIYYGPQVIRDVGEVRLDNQFVGLVRFSTLPYICSQTTITNTVIPCVTYQLAASNLSFRRFLTSSMASHPSALRQGLRAQFKYLIITPFRSMAATGEPFMASILLDSLDQCLDLAFQSELINLIVLHHWISPRLRIQWIVTTEKSHIRPLACDADWPTASRVDFELVTASMKDEGVE